MLRDASEKERDQALNLETPTRTVERWRPLRFPHGMRVHTWCTRRLREDLGCDAFHQVHKTRVVRAAVDFEGQLCRVIPYQGLELRWPWIVCMQPANRIERFER
jgi:hypothetical protein